MTTIALVDDHPLLRDNVAIYINSLENLRVIAVACDGLDLIEQIAKVGSPDILLLDLEMPRMGGYDTAAWIKVHCPATRIIMLSMYGGELMMVRLARLGVRGFLRKHATSEELKDAIRDVLEKGYYFFRESGSQVMDLLQQIEPATSSLHAVLPTEREIELIKLSCSEYTYKEIAEMMHLSPRTIDDMKESIFQKIGVKSRAGLVMYAIKHGIDYL